MSIKLKAFLFLVSCALTEALLCGPHSSGLLAQSSVARGEIAVEMRPFEALTGSWRGTLTVKTGVAVPASKVSFSMNRQFVLNGHYMRSDITAESDSGVVHSVAFLGYNPNDKCYEIVSLSDDGSPSTVESAFFDAKTNTLKMHGTERDHTGLAPTRGTLDMSNPSRHTFVGFRTASDGSEFQSHDGTIEKVK